MGVHLCSSCYKDTISGKGSEFCYHQREVLKNGWWIHREGIIKEDTLKIEFFERLKDFSLPINL